MLGNHSLGCALIGIIHSSLGAMLEQGNMNVVLICQCRCPTDQPGSLSKGETRSHVLGPVT